MKVAMSSNQLVDPCLKVLQEKAPDMPQYTGQTELQQASSYSVDGGYHAPTVGSNGHADGSTAGGGSGGGGPSPNSSHLSVQSGEVSSGTLTRMHKPQQVTSLNKTVREVHHLTATGDGATQAVEFVPYPNAGGAPTATYPQATFANYEPYPPLDPTRRYPEAYRTSYQDYEQYPTRPDYPYPTGAYPAYTSEPAPGYLERTATPPSASERSESPQPLPHDYLRKAASEFVQPGYDELEGTLLPPRQELYRITPSPGGPVDRYPDELTRVWNVDECGEPSQLAHGDEAKLVYGYAPGSPYEPVPGVAYAATNGGENGPNVPVVPRGIFEDEDELRRHLAMHPAIPSPSVDEDHRAAVVGMRWRDPNLTEVIGFLNNPNNVIKANAAAYLQHLCYMDDPNKQKTRSLGGIPPLVVLLGHDSPDVYRNACGALRNLSYGRQNDENKRAIKNAGGIPSLINLLRKSSDAEVKELVTGVLWNLSSCEDLKRSIIDDGLAVVVNHIIIPHSGWDPTSSGDTCWSTIFRNSSGVLRNVSSAGEYARKKLRECEGLVDSLLYVVRSAIDKSNIGNKSVENCVCVLRNLSYRCQEVEDPNYDKHPLPAQSRVAAQPKGDNLGCFGASKKKKEPPSASAKEGTSSGSGINSNTGTNSRNPGTSQRIEPVRGMELLWQPEVVHAYLALLQSCSNPETLEAAAGALQNLAACYWQPSIEIRAAVRKEKGLPILVELLRMEVDRVVCAVATALRNLAIDQRNKELIGKYAMRDLVQKLPSGNPQHDHGTSDDTIAAVLATLNEVIKKNAEFSRSLLEAGGVERLMNVTRQRQKYTPRVLKFAGQVLFTMWQHQELRDVYKKHGWKEHDFVTKTVAARNAGPNSPSNANSTLNRPMASQGGTRYEDRTVQRVTQNASGPSVSASINQSARSPAAAPAAPAPPGIYHRADDIPLADMSYPEGGSHAPQPTVPARPFVPTAPSIGKPGEPLYAQVNREKKKNRQLDGAVLPVGPNDSWTGDSISQPPASAGGDSWV